MLKPKVLVTFDSMKYTYCGYFSFGLGLGNALLKNNNQFELNFYLFKESEPIFKNRVNITYLSKIDRIFFKDKNKYAIVHFSDQTCRLLPNKINAAKIMTIHDMNRVHLKNVSKKRIEVYLKRLGNLISQCDKIVCISKFVANDVAKYFPDASHKISVIYNGADKLIPKEFHQPKYHPKKPFLFTIGLLSSQKGFHLLPSLLEGNDYILVISGRETNHKKNIIDAAIKYNCLDRVIFTGIISDEDKTWYYDNCEAFLFPSIAEGFGLPVIEAMHFGKPVFLSKYTSLPEIGGDVAYYFDNFDSEHMQTVFNNGITDYKLNLRRENIIKQSEKFSWEKAASEYLKLYQTCLNN